MTHTKSIIAGLGATAAIASAAVYNSATLETEFLGAEDYKFMEFVTVHGRSYATKAEFQFRSKVFKQYLAEMEAHNNDSNNTHTIGVNFLSDMTKEEKKRLNGYKPQLKLRDNHVFEEDTIPTSVDWVKAGAVTPVKNQGMCGSCWSFSTTGAVEGAMFLKTGSLQSYSEQQLVDCSGSYGNYGCNGGLMDSAFKYIESHELELESNYPYTGRDGSCHFETSKGVGKVKSYKDVTPHSVAQLKAAIAQQPVAIAIEADQAAFQGYTKGVITSGCGTSLDHGVLAVGYGTLNGQDFFLVKNSWGPTWGDQGYVRIGANSSNVCGILSSPSFPTE